jgi:nitrate/TMAO reductase-like tetraheme cytochrome c subunit
MRMKYSDITLETLKEGYSLYIGTCANCHEAKNIYRYTENDWASIIEDMAARANLKPVEKNAVYKYVLSIKATQL